MKFHQRCIVMRQIQAMFSPCAGTQEALGHVVTPIVFLGIGVCIHSGELLSLLDHPFFNRGLQTLSLV